MVFRTNIYENCDELFYCLAKWNNEVTYGMFWPIMLLTIGVVLVMATIRLGFGRAYGYASFSTGVLSIILSLTGLMTWGIASIFIINSVVAITAMVVSDK